MTLDLVYLVRPGDKNPELQMSLRSLQNFPHGDVWIVGHKPAWVTNVRHIRGNFSTNPHVNVFWNVITACEHPRMPEQVVIMNDDFYITRPLGRIPNWYRSPLQAHLDLIRSRGWWWQSLTATQAWLTENGHPRALSYELHKPIVIDTRKMADALHRVDQVQPANPPQWRTIYGNVHRIGGTPNPKDGKAYRAGPITKPFHSTDDGSFRQFEQPLRELFPEPSPYKTPIAERYNRRNARRAV